MSLSFITNYMLEIYIYLIDLCLHKYLTNIPKLENTLCSFMLLSETSCMLRKDSDDKKCRLEFVLIFIAIWL